MLPQIVGHRLSQRGVIINDSDMTDVCDHAVRLVVVSAVRSSQTNRFTTATGASILCLQLGACPTSTRHYQSGEIDRSGNISECGDKLMRHAFYEAANSHLRISKKWSTLRAGDIKLAKRIGAKKACMAVVRKLAIIMHRKWVEETDFRFGKAPVTEPA
jgi:transposase IS116/IS110/IS902 family protein